MNLSGLLGRIVYAILAGVVAFVVVFVIGAIVKSFSADAGLKIEQFSPVIGLLVGLVYFFGRGNNAPIV